MDKYPTPCSMCGRIVADRAMHFCTPKPEVEPIWFEWAYLGSDSHDGRVSKAKVFGGWVLRTEGSVKPGEPRSEALVFIPVPKHEWLTSSEFLGDDIM